jgi:hypothetical protein
MLILDKSRALDLMVAQSSREDLPEEFSLAGAARTARSGFRVAVYGPIEASTAAAPAPEWTWPGWGSRVPLPMAG